MDTLEAGLMVVLVAVILFLQYGPTKKNRRHFQGEYPFWWPQSWRTLPKE